MLVSSFVLPYLSDNSIWILNQTESGYGVETDSIDPAATLPFASSDAVADERRGQYHNSVHT
jgi:hypothetical protein